MMKRLATAIWLCAAVARAQAQTSATELMDSGHHKRARAIVEARYKASPSDGETLCLMSRIRHLWDQLDEAQKLAERAVAANPKDARFHYQLTEVLGDRAQHAGMLKQIGLGRQFKKEADLVLQLDPNHVGGLTNMVGFYVMAPGIIGGDMNKARAMADRIMKLDPVEGYGALMMIANHEKHPERNEEYMRKAVEARPESYQARMNLAGFLANNKKTEEAEKHAREALRIAPDRAGAYVLLASVAARDDKWQEVDAVLAQAEKADPDNFVPHFRVGNVCLSRKVDLPRAERYFRKYLTMEPEPNSPGHAGAHWRLGLVLEQMGRKQEAISELETAVKMDSSSQAKADLKRLKS